MRFAAALILTAVAIQARAEGTDLKPLAFMLGNWVGVAGDKDNQLGPGQGSCSFEAGLDNRVIIRRNTASYDSGVKHDDLMVIYIDGGARAIYFDNEGHVIHYNVSAPSRHRVVFESDGTQPGPKYRLSYWLEGELLKVTFEIAPPGSDYKTYTSGALKRK